jgi:hypothetical protein
MQSLIVSMVRLTAAITLYGLEQIQTTAFFGEGNGNLSNMAERFESAFNAMSDSLAVKLGPDKTSALDAITDLTKDLVGKSIDGISTVTPRNMIKTGGELWQKSSDALESLLGKPASANGSEPKLASDALS